MTRQAAGMGVVVALLGACALRGPAPDAPTPIAGFHGEQAREQLALEARFAAQLDATRLRERLRALTVAPHHTGSAGGLRVAQALADDFRAWGYDTRIETLYALMPTPRDRVVEMLAPKTHRVALHERSAPGRAAEDAPDSLPPYNAYSKDGEAVAEAVYVNYGLPEDYEVLARQGITVEGKIVIARYGRVYRGVKPRLAAERGALAALLYSDPADYGYGRGPVYPAGPFLPADGYQRGSVLDIMRFTGDPLTPGVGARTPHADWHVEDAAAAIAPIPVQPLSANDVRPILQAMQGPVVPQDWHGALPIPYRLGGGVKLRVRVVQDWAITPLHNVVAVLKGSDWPDEWVLRGNNHDAWNYGALVAGSGMVALMEEARAIGALAKTGWRPRRTLVYLAWDGEEQGLLGSTEWAEAHAAELRAKAVAYLNTGINTRGALNAGGSHVLETLVDEVARASRDPGGQLSVHARATGADGTRLRLAALGIGSDFTPFLQHLGIASLDYAFEGEADSGVYHSVHDNFDFYDRFGDPGYHHGVALAEVSGRTMLRLANAPLLPFDFAGVAAAVADYLGELRALAAEAGATLDFAPLSQAIDAIARSATAFGAARGALAASGAVDDAAHRSAIARLNQLLRESEQRLTQERGLPGRPWYRHLLYAPGLHTGYGVKTMPGVREAIELQQWDVAQREIERLAAVLVAYAAHIDAGSDIAEALSMGDVK